MNLEAVVGELKKNTLSKNTKLNSDTTKMSENRIASSATKVKRTLVNTAKVITNKSRKVVARTDVESNDESTESERSCNHDHNNLSGKFTEETDVRYFNLGGELVGSKCSNCKIIFKDTEDGTSYVVRNKKLFYIYNGRDKS